MFYYFKRFIYLLSRVTKTEGEREKDRDFQTTVSSHNGHNRSELEQVKARRLKILLGGRDDTECLLKWKGRLFLLLTLCLKDQQLISVLVIIKKWQEYANTCLHKLIKKHLGNPCKNYTFQRKVWSVKLKINQFLDTKNLFKLLTYSEVKSSSVMQNIPK